MRTKINYFKIGLFVISTSALLVAGLIAVGAGIVVRDRIEIETYIDESVQGLSIGSSVMQRGVQIGTVKDITFVPREYGDQFGPDEFHKYDRYVLVIASVDRRHFREGPGEVSMEETVRTSVQKGLRLQLSPQGITGIYYLQADYVDPVRFPPMEITWKPKRLYIPSTVSTLTTFTQSADQVLQKLKQVDFAKVASSLDQTLTAIRTAVADAQVAKARAELSDLMATLKQTILDAKVGESQKELMQLVADLRRTNATLAEILGPAATADDRTIREVVTQLHATLSEIESLVAGEQADIDEAVNNIQRAAQNLRDATERVRATPSLLIRGEEPERSEVTK